MRPGALSPLAAGAALVALPSAGWAHPGGVVAPHDVWHAWNLAPLVVLSLAAGTFVYLRGVRALWAHAGAGRVVSRARAACGVAGLAVVALALVSPLDALGETLFSFHMLQHLLLMTLAPPLLVAGEPLLAAVWALEAGRRRRAAGWWIRARPARQLRAAWRVASAPLVAALLHTVAVWAWHLPRWYDAALRDERLHAAEHLSFVATGALVWWSIVGLSRRPSRGAQAGAAMLALFVTFMQTGALGAVLTLARTPYYPVHGPGARAWGLSLLADQQLAGLVMWVPGGLFYLAAAAVVGAMWLRASAARRSPVREVTPRALATPAAAIARAMALALAAAPGLSSCARPAGANPVDGGDPARGAQAFVGAGCAACHTIRSVAGPHGKVGPPLDEVAERSMLAGQLPNTPENMVRWISAPELVEPGTGMPNLHLPDQTVRDIAAYLYTQHGR